jgi:peptidoglycan/LPS O-acetylase OafA/YrhL
MAARANLVFVAGLATMALSFWLFRERTGFMGNSLGWPVLSLGLAMLVFAGAQTGSWIGRRAFPGAAWLAAVSYSLYLVHKPMYGLVQAQLGEALDRVGNGYVAFAVYGVASLLAAALLYYAVERPGLRMRRRWQARGTHRASIPAH